MGYESGKAVSFHIIGLYYYNKSDFSKSFDFFQKSLIIKERLGDINGIATIFNNYGVIYSKQGNLIKSLESNKKALEIRKEINDSIGISQSLNNIGVIFYELHDFEKAIKYYEKSLRLNEDLERKFEISRVLNNIALIYEKQNELDKSLDYYNKCIKIGEENDYKHILGWAYNGKGIVFEKMQQYDEALKLFELSLECREEIDEKNGIAQSCNSIGDLYLKKQQFQNSRKYLMRAYKISMEIGSTLNQKDAAKGLSIICEQAGQYKSSLKYYKLFKQLSDSLISESNIKKLTAYEINTQHEKEIHTIELEQQKKDVIQAEKNKRQTMLTHSSLLGFVLMLLIVFLIFRSYKQKQKSNELLSSQYQKIENKNKQLHDQNEEIQQLNEELSSSNEALYSQNEELENHRNNLEKLVKERTVDLEITKEKAEESDRLKSAFLANMSHEIRTPMNAIVGFTNLLNDPELTDETKEELTIQINHNSGILLNLINDIIDIAKIESGQLTIKKEECSVNEVIEKLVTIYQNKLSTFTNNQIEFLVKIPEKNIVVFTDPLRFQQILVNLIDNAIKFTEKGKVEVGIVDENNKTDISFYVKDTGIGLSEKQKEIIFKRFTKAEDNRKKLYRGAGLGLAICKDIVEILEGKIWVESEEDKGSTFYFSIPLS